MTKRLRILLIDDDEDEYVLVQDLLADRSYVSSGTEPVGFELDWTPSYHKALEILKQQEYDVYLVDYHLGEHDGLELLQEVTRTDCNRAVILMTGQGNYDVDIKGMNIGATDYLVKGEVTAALLERTIRYAVERKRTEEALRASRDELETRVQERTQELLVSNEEVRRQAERAEALVRVANRLNAQLDLEAVSNAICEETARALKAQAVSLALYDDSDGLFYHAAGTGLPGNFGEQIQPVPDTIYKELNQKYGPAIIIPDIGKVKTGLNNQALTSMGAVTMVSIIMSRDTKPVGCLNIYTFTESRQFTPDEIVLLKGIADQAALAIVNAQLYADLEQTLEEEQGMRARLILAEKHSAMSRMVASVAHELNNPIQTIQNCIFLIQQDLPAEAPSYKFLEMSISEARRVANLVGQLREIYRPNQVGTLRPLDLQKILNEVHDLLEPHLQHQHVTWQQESRADGLIIQGIADQLKQVFLNISLNAIEAMQPDGGKLVVSIQFQEAKDKIGIAFQDTGPGIRPDDQNKIFEPFFTTKENGTGLGLSICYDLIQRHSGDIQVESTPGQGACFTIWLPMNHTG